MMQITMAYPCEGISKAQTIDVDTLPSRRLPHDDSDEIANQ